MKKLRIAKEYGTWYYKRIRPNQYNDLAFDGVELYDENKEQQCTCIDLDECKQYIKTGELR